MPETQRSLFIDCSPDMRALIDDGAASAVPNLEIHDGDPKTDDLPRLLDGVAVALNGHTPMPAGVLERCADLRRIIFLGTGASSYIDMAAAERLGIDVDTIRDYGSRSVAEHAIALAFAGARRITEMDAGIRAGRWQPMRGMALSGRVLGVLGAGAIGREAITLGAALGMDVRAWSRSAVPGSLPCRAVSLDEAIGSADVLSLHLALTAQTRHMLGAAEFSRMKAGSILVNTARGGLIDEQALIAALQQGRPGHAALDVFETEPLPAGHPLTALPNVTLTAHAGFNTADAARNLLQLAVDRLAEHLRA
ncbi:NAD(P)-dependent oxidoreductase [Fodinicurvata sp. EGI_FJ10296]|uniref:2-hydroxyacid dehydrogenase n=1 Tax=Fodinicurvata sp. EGI_FJ10296 TaxID=3231908 RepID=UPI003454D391